MSATNGWRECGPCGGRGGIGRGYKHRACSVCRGVGSIEPVERVPLRQERDAAREAMPSIEALAGYCKREPCYCAALTEASAIPRPCIPCRCRRYFDALMALGSFDNPPPTTHPQGTPPEGEESK